jgi:hypothetical protein
MPEVPFGSVTPIWSAAHTPAFGYTPVPQNPQSIGSVPVATPQGAAMLSNGTISGAPMGTTFPINAYGLSSPVPASAGLTSNTLLPLASPLAGGDIRFGIAAPALLAAVGLRRGQPWGPTSENDVEDFIYDALELLSVASDVEVRCEGGRVTLTGSVSVSSETLAKSPGRFQRSTTCRTTSRSRPGAGLACRAATTKRRR